MDIKIKVDEEKVLREAFNNFPEYAVYCFQCIDWQYEPFIFKFTDTETGKKYTVTLADAKRGYRKLVKAIQAGQVPGLGVTLDNITEPGKWDDYAVDGLLQFAILGEIIYV